MNDTTQQLELFPTLPLLLRPPRRLRRLGFELEQIERDVATLTDCCRDLDRNETRLASVVIEAKAIGAIGHVHPSAYFLVVKTEETRELAQEKLRACDEVYRAVQRQLDRGINKLLKRTAMLQRDGG